MIRTSLAMLCVLNACTTESPRNEIRSSGPDAVLAKPRPGTLPIDKDAPQAPLSVRWAPISDSGGRLRLEGHIELKALLAAPVNVHVEIPRGLELVSGETAFQIPADTTPGDVVRAFEFAYQEAPVEDLKLVADLSGGTFGVHAADAYRFGRHEPQPVRPQPTGPSIKLGDTDLGPAIQIDKK